jgi:hypothetical protein
MSISWRMKGSSTEHDPEKWAPVFGKDHVQARSQDQSEKRRGPMSARAEEFRRRAREATRNLAMSEDRELRALSLTLAQSYISLARTEEWLEGETAQEERAVAPKRAR